MRHNKKRNTAFLFETLVGELTKSIVHGDSDKQTKTKSLISKYFQRGTNLYEELQLYKALLETRGLEPIVAEKLIFEVKEQRRYIGRDDVFREQSDLISDMNQEYSKSVFSNFVPNYKSLATLAQLFNNSLPVKERVLLEAKIIESLTSPEEEKPAQMEPIDSLVYKTFVEKFNDKYGETLSEEQKNLLSKYISSFADNGIGLKLFLNEEVGRLKVVLREALQTEEISGDEAMFEKTARVIDELDSYASKDINETMVKSILKIQQLVQEINP